MKWKKSELYNISWIMWTDHIVCEITRIKYAALYRWFLDFNFGGFYKVSHSSMFLYQETLEGEGKTSGVLYNNILQK